jgi:hypothetical protein
MGEEANTNEVINWQRRREKGVDTLQVEPLDAACGHGC